MRLTTFLTALVVGGVCGVAGFAFATYTMEPAPPPQATLSLTPVAPVPAEPTPTAAVDAVPEVPPAAAAAAPTAHGTREIDITVFSYVGRDIGSDKLKDVSKGKPFKVNVYQDPGSPTANRVKVDLDRDEKWDEKFTFKDGTITRDVAPADDEAYTVSYRWDGKEWVAGG
ncbi:MAG: hypothetical protein V4850_07305 [Myxococcota bacterium]